MTSSPSYRSGEPIPGTQYRFVREIGAGGHGSVYGVEHTFLEAPAVMKLLHADLIGHSDLAARMTREARTLAKLRHPNVVEVRDGGITAEPMPRPYFVMEPLNGMALRDMLKKTRGGLGVLPSLRIVTDILLGLDHAHNAGVIHRDIKPDNVYLHRAQSSVTVAKILDFGIAHLLLGQRYTGRYFLGTPRYAAPEQLRGETPTAQTDIYAAGLVLYELLTGEAPFSSIKEIGALLNAHLNETLPKPSLMSPDVPLTLDKFLESMLAKDPAERPPTAFAAAVALREIRSRLEADLSDSIHAPEFKTEPSPMEDVLYAASPDDPPIVTEVAPPLGINDTTPDDVPKIASLREALAAGANAATTEPMAPGRPSPQRGAPVRTVPMAAPRKAEIVDRHARTRTSRESAAPPGRKNDTEPLPPIDVGLLDTTPAPTREAAPASGEKAHTTSVAIVLSEPRPSAGARAPGSRRGGKAAFRTRVITVALVLGGAAAALTTLCIRVMRTGAEPSSAALPAPSPVEPLPAATTLASIATTPVTTATDTAPPASAMASATPSASVATRDRPRTTPSPMSKKTPSLAAPPPSAIPFE